MRKTEPTLFFLLHCSPSVLESGGSLLLYIVEVKHEQEERCRCIQKKCCPPWSSSFLAVSLTWIFSVTSAEQNAGFKIFQNNDEFKL
jgi:hypothetical protein